MTWARSLISYFENIFLEMYKDHFQENKIKLSTIKIFYSKLKIKILGGKYACNFDL